MNFAKFLRTLFYRTPLVAASTFMIPDYIINTNKRKYLKINMYLSQWPDCSEAVIQEVLWKKGVFKNFAKFTGKQLCWSLFLKSWRSKACNFILKKRLHYRCFPVNFVKFLKRPILRSTSGRLLLTVKWKTNRLELKWSWFLHWD